jgi:hypothetical protein
MALFRMAVDVMSFIIRSILQKYMLRQNSRLIFMIVRQVSYFF